MSTFIEQNCTVEFNGSKFTSGGAHIVDCPDGFRRGVVYAKPASEALQLSPNKPCPGIVTDWHGNKITSAYFGPVYRGNFCKMRSVSFTLDGIKYTGRYCPDWATAVRVRSTKRVK